VIFIRSFVSFGNLATTLLDLVPRRHPAVRNILAAIAHFIDTTAQTYL
jgi:hypothetical protein